MDMRSGERLDDLGRGGLRIIQHPERFPFAMDPVLLAHFTTVRRHSRVLDLGTGCGVIPLLLSALHPTARITGLELQPDTADMAARSVSLNGLNDSVRIDCGDYRQVVQLYGHERFDVVTLNPPYREPGTGAISPASGRAGARHELSGGLGDALEAAATAVKFGGRVAVVFLAERLADLVTQLRSFRLEPKRLRLIHPRAGRPANLLLLEAAKGGGPGLKIEPPLIVYEEGQTYTAEMRAIYNA
ncbi:MAG TPA: tRNA1(Val) (adenine(37)-N6)-methyltransferase [Symbiobacteriaceae bacterium]|nr:tRNA1(Val) (adenine(37)-N6)-methyltransferase [Symbiobacteriaceae bacterium]